MTRLLRNLIFATFFAALPAVAGEALSVESVLAKAAELDGKAVTVTGKVLGFKQKTSRAGNAYFTFKLKGGKDEPLNIYSQGKSEKEWKDGDLVVVDGIFRKEKKVQDFVVKNEIDATPKEGKPYGVKAPPKS
ncbi:MAG TPA: hypothetical protein VM328_10045 [Fimbriimonadaceae bacterium]|nr:hypothetical protein [Fimbriimonadaceae bacterium]